MALPNEKSRVAYINETQPSSHSNHQADALIEDEPTSIYEISWRTLLAVFALSLANVCAALANTVR